ncbi:hypothetical protein KDA11_03665 [Candidatus Saccharibacteria bacterium]|nr:hypothetical protein [Candidatus Saccharibacteria bacterium]
MAVICPTITATTVEQYRQQIELITPFAHRIHIDLADGVFAPNKLIDLMQVWWPVGVTADIHLMYESVLPYIDQLTDHKPHMVIVHAESVGSYYEIAKKLKEKDIKVGVALLPETPVEKIVSAIDDIDHVLIFSGDLGYFGGVAKMTLLQKARTLKKLKPTLEIGWDGGVSVSNVKKLVLGGVDVLNAGGAIHNAKNPEKAYNRLNIAITEISTTGVNDV